MCEPNARAESAPDDEFDTRPETARLLKVPVKTLDRWAYRHEGPPFYRIGKHARYRRSETLRWMEQQKVRTE
jgi:excisionase family DNA binding protein